MTVRTNLLWRGREHLVDLERSEQICLVIRDHRGPEATCWEHVAGGFESRSHVASATDETGSKALTRFGAKGEQI